MSGEITAAVPANGTSLHHGLLKPLQFLVCKGPENDRKWTIGEEAVKYLESIEEPLAVTSPKLIISVCLYACCNVLFDASLYRRCGFKSIDGNKRSSRLLESIARGRVSF